MRPAWILLAIGCGSASRSTPPAEPARAETPVIGSEHRVALLEFETSLVAARVRKIARESYRNWAVHHVDDECPVDPHDLFRFTKEPDVDVWGTQLRIACHVRSRFAIEVVVDSAGPDLTFDTDDDVRSTP